MPRLRGVVCLNSYRAVRVFSSSQTAWLTAAPLLRPPSPLPRLLTLIALAGFDRDARLSIILFANGPVASGSYKKSFGVGVARLRGVRLPWPSIAAHDGASRRVPAPTPAPPLSCCEPCAALPQHRDLFGFQRDLASPTEPWRLAVRRLAVSERLSSLSDRTSPELVRSRKALHFQWIVDLIRPNFLRLTVRLPPHSENAK